MGGNIDSSGRIIGGYNSISAISTGEAELNALREVNNGKYYCTACKAKISFRVDSSRNRDSYFEIDLSGLASCADRALSYTEHKLRVIVLSNGNIDSVNMIQKGSWKHLSSVNSGGCHITSIVCRGMGYNDDCFQLTQIRRFRDEYLKQQGYDKDIEDYYKNSVFYASMIGKAAEKDPELYSKLYKKYIIPAVSAIEKDEMKTAHKILQEYLNDIKKNKKFKKGKKMGNHKGLSLREK